MLNYFLHSIVGVIVQRYNLVANKLNVQVIKVGWVFAVENHLGSVCVVVVSCYVLAKR